MGNTCDVLYIHATKHPTGEDKLKYAIMPMGIIGILNDLRSRGVQVLGMNYAIEKALDPDFDLDQFLADTKYKVLLTDLHWYEHSLGAMYTVERSKAVHPQIPTVIGGYTTTIFAEEILENFPRVDYAVTGDSDLPMARLVDRLLGRSDQSPMDIPNLVFRSGGAVVRSATTWAQTDLDGIDFLPVDYFLHDEYIPVLSTKGITGRSQERWLCIARGCKFDCAYCCGGNHNMQALFRRCNVLTRSPEKVAEDFYRLTQMGIRRVSPSHDFQMFGKRYYQDIFARIRETSVKPGLYLECFQLPTKAYIDDMVQTFGAENMVLVISPISGNEQLRRENGKLFSNEDFYEIVSYILEKKIPLQLYYTLNLVGETRDQFYDTYFQLSYLRNVLGLDGRNVFYQRVVIDPLAGMRQFPEIDVQLNTFMDYYRYCHIPTGDFTNTGYTDNGQVPAEEKMQMYRELYG